MPKDRKFNLNFEKLLDESVKIHGHLCPGQVLGVRMSMLGLKKIGIKDPKGSDRKDLMVFVEIDRCATDAIQSVTGCSAGKRTLKLLDYGKMAATFVNLKTGKAGTTQRGQSPETSRTDTPVFRGVRIIAKEESKTRAKNYFPQITDKYKCQTAAYKVMPDKELFECKGVKITIPEQDMPGRPMKRVRCDKCGEHVQDGRETYLDGKVFCKACAHGAYYVFRK